MQTGLLRHTAAGIVAALLLGGTSACRAPANDAPAVVNDAETAVPSVLKSSAEAWNAADLPGHLRPYTDDATFMGGNGPIQGRDRVGESLAKSFWQEGKPKQQLAFDRITVRPLGDRHALSTGHFVLTGGGEADRSGWFSLTWEKTPAGWQIVHDHSS